MGIAATEIKPGEGVDNWWRSHPPEFGIFRPKFERLMCNRLALRGL